MTSRPSSRARRTSSVRYSSPVVGDGASDSMRRRSQAASNAYRPELISLFASSSSSASLTSTIASTMPNSLRTMRPSSAGSAAKTVARAMAASSWRRASRSPSRSVGRDERARRPTGRGSRSRRRGRRRWRRGRRRRCRAARPGARSRLDRRRRRGWPRPPGSRRRPVSWASCRRRRPPRPRRRGRRPASAGRTAGAAPWGAPTSCACRGPPRGPRRWFGRLAQAWARDLEGSCAAPGVRGAVARAACGARWAVEECHQMEPGWYGRPAGTVKRGQPDRAVAAGS